jgi:hypothetical protein
LLASKPPLEFHESSESFRENKDVRQEFFEVVRRFTTIVEGLEKTLKDF